MRYLASFLLLFSLQGKAQSTDVTTSFSTEEEVSSSARTLPNPEELSKEEWKKSLLVFFDEEGFSKMDPEEIEEVLKSNEESIDHWIQTFTRYKKREEGGGEGYLFYAGQAGLAGLGAYVYHRESGVNVVFPDSSKSTRKEEMYRRLRHRALGISLIVVATYFTIRSFFEESEEESSHMSDAEVDKVLQELQGLKESIEKIRSHMVSSSKE